jgi:hypothetical protein
MTKIFQRRLFDQTKAYDIDYLNKIAKLKDPTRHVLNEFYMKLLLEKRLTKNDIVPPLNVMYCALGNISDKVFKTRIDNLPKEILDMILFYYQINIDQLYEFSNWPTFGQLKKYTREQLMILFRNHHFAITNHELNEKMLRNKFIDNMNLLGYKIDTSDFEKIKLTKTLKSVNIYEKEEEEEEGSESEEEEEEQKVKKQTVKSKILRPSLILSKK